MCLDIDEINTVIKKMFLSVRLCFSARGELSGDHAGSPLLSAVCHQHSDHPAAPLHPACLQGSTDTLR